MWEPSFEFISHKRWHQTFDIGRRESILDPSGWSLTQWYKHPAHRTIDQYHYFDRRDSDRLIRATHKTTKVNTGRGRVTRTATRQVFRVQPSYGGDNSQHFLNELTYESLRHEQDFTLL